VASLAQNLAPSVVSRDDKWVVVQGRSLVGREPELTALAELVEDADAGRGRVALITGEAGIGKTSLAEAVGAMVRESRFQVAWGRCSSAEMPSYWPWTQVLNTLLGAAELLDPGRFASRPELYAAAAEAIEACTRVNPVLVIFEDVHWADPGSLALLEFLAGMVAGQRLLVLITSRDDFGVLASIAGVRRISLSGLDREASSALVRRIVAMEPSQEYLAEVHRRSGGNPFFTTEVARLQASRGTSTGTVPAGVRQVLEHRLARLRQESVELLRVASVVGAPHVGRLAGVTGLTEDEIAALLDEPAAAGVVVAGAFAHDLMRETLYQGMSPSRRAALHRQVAEHLQAEGPAELARHWSLASGEDARPRAAQLAVVAGDLAAAGLAHEQAVSYYRLALELGGADLTVRRRLGEAQVLAGQIGAGRNTLRVVAEQARASSAGEELGYAVLAMGGGVGGFEVDMFDPEQAPLLEDALRLLPARDGALRAAVLARLSVVGTASMSAGDRAGLAEEAAAMARRVGDTEARLRAGADPHGGPDADPRPWPRAA
jgi:predicted ATPase